MAASGPYCPYYLCTGTGAGWQRQQASQIWMSFEHGGVAMALPPVEPHHCVSRAEVALLVSTYLSEGGFGRSAREFAKESGLLTQFGKVQNIEVLNLAHNQLTGQAICRICAEIGRDEAEMAPR